MTETALTVADVQQASARLAANVGRALVGLDEAIRLLTVALLSDGHVLLEEVPGTGKTTLARALARVSGKELSIEALVKAGLANAGEAVKLVGKAEVKGKYSVTVNRVTASVRSAIEAAGGKVTETDRAASDDKADGK